MSRFFQAEVAGNIHLSQTHNILKITPLQPHVRPAPGQFYLLRASETLDPLLRRPFSILRWDDTHLEFLIRLKGRGTLLLRNMRPGDGIDMLGPLGNGYPEPLKDETPILVAGGVGIASVFPLIGSLHAGARLFYGAMNSAELYLLDDIKKLTGNIYLSTDDGSMGFKGNAVERLIESLNDLAVANPTVYACGPEGMIASLLKFLNERGIPGYISFEEKMACGIGACLGCVIKTGQGYKRVCKEGPVFNVREIVC